MTHFEQEQKVQEGIRRLAEVTGYCCNDHMHDCLTYRLTNTLDALNALSLALLEETEP